MPVGRDGVGRSPYTRIKRDQFRRMLAGHLAACWEVWRNEERTGVYRYVDLTGGVWSDEWGPASPAIFIAEAQRGEVASEAYICEFDSPSGRRLSAAVAAAVPTAPARWRVLLGDSGETSHQIVAAIGRARGELGLIYADPNGSDVPTEAIARIATAGRRMDVLLAVNATAYKREGKGRRFLDDVAAVPRAHAWIRHPIDCWQRTFVLLSNYAGLKVAQRSFGFESLESAAGRAIAERLNLTKGERGALVQPALLPFVPTDPTPSTFGTRGSWPSGRPSSDAPAAGANGAVSGHRPSRTTSATRPGGRST